MLTVTFILFIGVIFLSFALLFLKYENSQVFSVFLTFFYEKHLLQVIF